MKNRKTCKGKNNHFFGKRMKPHWGKYKGILMRSNWELWFAQWLNLSNVDWVYEHKTFDLGDTTYTPDFYLFDFNCYIEIKGYASDIFKKKFKLFKQKYSKINIKILMLKDLQELGIL